jgi:iron(III) transport system ATP-binding protein
MDTRPPDAGRLADDAPALSGRAPADRTPAMSLEGVCHRYGDVLAVRDVSLSVAPGEIVCLVGPSGCGKSTLLRLAAGLEDLQHGTVHVGGRLVADPHGAVPPEGRDVGLVFQDYALFPHLTVLDNVRFGLTRLPTAEQKQRALAALEQVGMADYARAHPHMLSGGQQQRVALARAMAPQPRVLLLDEPFSGLDTRLRRQVRDDTLHVLQQQGAATVIVTHDPEEAMFLADRIALMEGGRLTQLGTPVELYTRPADSFAAAFFGEVNRLVGTVRDGAVATPVGRVPAALAEGAAAEVLIRPEALLLSPDPSDTAPVVAKVEAARLLGRTSLVHLSVARDGETPLHIHARVPGQFLPQQDSLVSIALDARQAFVFAA